MSDAKHTVAADPAPADPAPAHPAKRGPQTVRGIVYSMALVGLFVAFLYVIVLRPTGDSVRVVNVADAAIVANTADNFAVLIPADLDESWRATSARYSVGPTDDTGQWYNGYLTGDGQFIAVVQQDYDLDKFLPAQLEGAKAEGDLVINGETWQKYYSPTKNRWALVNDRQDATIMVLGTVNYERLADFAARLTPAQGSQ